MSNEKCENCSYFKAFEKHSSQPSLSPRPAWGICRRYAPQNRSLVNVTTENDMFPPMVASQWCGDYKRKVTE